MFDLERFSLLSKPVIALIALFSFVANWNNYFLPLLMLPSSDGYPLQVGLAELPRASPVLALGRSYPSCR